MPDITILSWITAEVDQALERVRTELATYSAPPHDAAALARCPEHLHQVSGALNMVGLSGATRFCEALENSFARLDASGAGNAAVVDRAVLQLKQFVDDVANGQPDVAVRLYPAYRELAELQGLDNSSEIDLFFPDLTPAAPAHPSPKSLEKEELASFLQSQRTRWQRGILAWLRRQPNGLEDMREMLRKLRKFWRQYMVGEPKGRSAFGERARTLQSKAAPLQSPQLDRLLATIAEVTDTLPDPHPADSDALLIEMAAAFLLADSILDTYGRAPADLDQQLELLSGWLRAAASGKPVASPPAGLRPEFLQEISAIQLRAQVAREILTNLQQVEQVLDAYARGQSSDRIVQALVPQLRQIHGALSVLRWDRAVRALQRCQGLLATLAPGGEDMDWLAEGLSSIGLFITPCLEGREPRQQAIDTFLERFDKRPPAVARATPAAAPAGQANQLLQIFLEEAA